MKRTKRIISLLLTSALTLTGLCGASTAGAEETAPTKGVVFSEGFEEWDVGVIKDTVGSYTVGNLKFDLKENDKLEIAVNNYGNKALKITKGSTESNTIRYVFPKQYAGKVNVTFDFLSEHNSRNFSEFGNLEYNTAPNTIYKYTHYQDHLYVYAATGQNILRNALSSTRHNGYVKFTTTYNTVDNAAKAVSFGYRRSMKTSDGDPEIKEATVNSSTSKVPEKIYGIRWVLGTRSGFDGKDAATSADDTINAGIYWIDNIVVNVDAPVISEENPVVEENFDGYTGSVLHNGGTKSWEKYIDLNMLAGDCASVETDPVTNNKALKIVKADNSNLTSADISFGEVEDKVVKISYDVRFQNHSRYPINFPNILDKSGATTKYGLLYNAQLFWDKLGSANGGTVVANKIRDAANKNEYVKFEYTLDLKNQTVYSDVKSSTAVMNSKTSALKSNSIKTLQFGWSNNANRGPDNDGTDANNGVYWIDNIRMEILTLKLENISIKDGETKVPAGRNLSLTFNEAIADNAADEVMVIKNDEEMLEIGTDYKVTLSADAKTMTIAPVSGEWNYESKYTVMIGAVKGKISGTVYEGTTVNFMTDSYSPVLVNDYFENYTLGQKWEGPGEFKTGNMTFRLTAGDSIEYAYDAEAGVNGFKLIKSNTDGDLDFIYSFPGGFTDGKYMVKVDERIENHSKGHKRWPALLSGETSGEIQRMGLRATSYWLQQTGSLSIDRYGVSHTDNTNSRHIAASTGNNRTVVFGELSTGAGTKFGLYTPSTDSYIESLEPVATATTLGGVLMKMSSAGTEQNFSDCYQLGTQVDDDTVNNPDNFGIAWIYGVTVEKVTLDVKNTSFDNDFTAFSPDKNFTVTFNQKLDVNTVNTANIELYENDNQISAYEYTINLAEDEKTVTINPVSGIKYGTEYTIKVSKNVKAKDTQVAPMYSSKEYKIQTVGYNDTVAPDIIWSTLPDGSKNVEIGAKEIILNTNGVLLDTETINKDNIKVYENGVEISDYTVEPSGLYAVKVNLASLKKNATYKITVSGLLSGGSEGLGMTEDFETTFTTRGDIYTANVTSGITADGEISYITAELFNKSGADINYQVIGVLKDAEGKIISVANGSNGTLANDNVTDIKVENTVDADAVSYDLYIWDGIDTMKPLVKKAVTNPVNARTYGYDKYMDSTKDLTVVYIGGSITQQRQYSNPLSENLKEMFEKDNEERNVTFNVQGLGGTNSTLGLYRFEKDVIAKNPDLVFIEFAVNDSDTASANRVKSMEGILRKLMNMKHQPMVVLLDVTTANYASLDVIADWKPLMDAYGIGYINVAQYIKDNEATAENPDGLYVWKEADLENYPNATALTATDGVHPTAAGGKVYADYMYNVISENPENFFKKMTVVEEPVSGHEYNNPRMIPWNAAEYDTNWTCAEDMGWTFYDGVAKAKTAGATLTYKFTGTTIGLFLPKSKTGTTATYSIDNGKYTGTVSCYGAVSTDMPMMSMISTSLEDKEHTITLTVDNAENVNFRFGHFIVD